MNIFIVYAHPEPRSLNGSLKDFAVAHLQAAGHAVQVSDLYAMQWKAELDAQDSLDPPLDGRFDASADSRRAFDADRQSADITQEQDRLRWADVLILQFPLWWYSMPAIMKGWVDRVYANGFAYGVGEHSDARWGERFGEGVMSGKRAMVMVSTGGWESHYAPRGIGGPIDDILFPIQHGILFYPGFDVLPPFVTYRTGKTDDARFASLCTALGERLDTLSTTPAIPYRPQNAGEYDIPSLTLKAEMAPGVEGFGAHRRERQETRR